MVAPNKNVVKGGILIESTAKLGSGSSGIPIIRNLSRNSTLLTIIIRVVGTLQKVFTYLIMITHVHKIADQPLMNLMASGR